ncbi:phospholipase D-like domain-containing protein [Jannaschia formosa]|uniref:phospholipase D-like domain-containing protein n=1 Tax=Jannaschia formosa TaxID=2259592 RepID=UPI000E1BAE07|nr:phosphatidylserine/phosphatidylglycerophosphate/cardiolipin synthase family protein [Jannaschia formosa]TFL16253.1 phosphatidylserine/phosphatidylglycerophosphate/cardiolipin synthase family protein [Jannaschia formosa]
MSMTAQREAETNPSRWRCPEPRWELFHHNKSVWEAVLERCDAARHSIDLEQYILGTEGIGRRLLDLLASKARQGVAVRVLADGLGSHGLLRSEGARTLLRCGGRVAMYNGLSDLLRRPIRRAHRLHRKTLILDGSSVMVGGSCYEDRMSDWRDTMLHVDGPLPPAVLSEFERAWRSAHRRSAAVDPASRAQGTAEEGWFYSVSGPLVQARHGLGEVLAGKIARAGRSVALTTPYLVPNRRLWRALVAAVERGAKVRLLMPARSDHPALDVIGRGFVRSLLRRGVDVRGYTPGMLHAKVALVDGGWSSVSSFNLDLLSANLNLESGVFSTSQSLYGALAEQMDADLARSERF